MQLLQIKNLQFLHCGPISFQIKPTEIIGLSGASGSGKSRLLRALADLDDHQGEIQLDEMHQQTEIPHLWRKKIALLSAETHWWFDTLSAHFSNVDDPVLLAGLNALGFSVDCLQWDVARLSSGEKQRLGLLRLLQNKPQVLLLDEPTANLDKTNSHLFESFVAKYLSNNQACAVWVSHDAEQLARVATRCYRLEEGVLTHVD